MKKLLFELRKLIPSLLMPFKLSLLLIVIGLVKKRRSLVVAGVALMYLAGLPLISDSLRLALENQYPRIEAAQCPTADAIVVLSGYAGDSKLRPNVIAWNHSVDRFEKGVQLVRMRKAPVVLFTDAQMPTDDRHSTVAELVRQAAIDHDVPADAIRLTKAVSTTADEANAVRDFLRETGGHRIILVTSAVHMGRSALLFRHAGIEFVPFPADYESDGPQWKLDSFLPSPSSVDQTEQCLHEMYGSLIYHVFK